MQDLNAGIAMAEAAVEAIPDDHADRAAHMHNLARCLSRRYERTGQLQDLEASIARSKVALEAAPRDHPVQASTMNNLGTILFREYEQTRNPQDLETGIPGLQIALQHQRITQTKPVNWEILGRFC